MTTATPPKEVPIDENIVKSLIKNQFPQFAGLNVRFLASGWDNENYRLGDRHIVRLPRRQVAVESILNENAWLSRLPDDLPIAFPKPAGEGVPDEQFPWPWSILPWFDGENATRTLPEPSEAGRLIDFLQRLHGLKEVEEAPESPYRSEALFLRDEAIQTRMDRIAPATDLCSPFIRMLWRQAVETPPPPKRSLLHGDLHGGNIIIHRGRIEAIIDWGDICSGDPAVDLSSLWMLFPDKNIRREALAAYGADEALVRRATGWAVYFGVVLTDVGRRDNPDHEALGKRILTILNESKGHVDF